MSPFLHALAAGASCLLLTAVPVGAAEVGIHGNLDLIFEDDGTGIFGNTPIGTAFSGFIDDTTFNGLLGNGTTTVSFGCCLAAGGLEVFNDDVLDADNAAALNQLSGVPGKYGAGDIVDSLNLEGDAQTAAGGRIEIGVSYLFSADTFADASPGNYPFDPKAVQMALFFVLEENAAGETVYDVVGRMPMAPIPEPATLALWLGGLAGLGLARRRRTAVA